MRLPRHIAIVMDGNGRWAAARGLPRVAGHRAGVKSVRLAIEECSRRGIEALTLFAFSSENWNRPREEVSSLMGLFLEALDREVAALHENGVRIRFIGNRELLSRGLLERMEAAERLTGSNGGLKLQVAVSYGGRWDILKAAQKLARQCLEGARSPDTLSEADFAEALELRGLPEPDLFIRTGGEQRISNFLLWNLAYTELYFTERLWPDFDAVDLARALDFFAGRERRFGRTTEQLGGVSGA